MRAKVLVCDQKSKFGGNEVARKTVKWVFTVDEQIFAFNNDEAFSNWLDESVRKLAIVLARVKPATARDTRRKIESILNRSRRFFWSK